MGEQRQRLICSFAALADVGARPPRLVYVTRLPSPDAFVLGRAVVVDEALIDLEAAAGPRAGLARDIAAR